MPKSPEGGITIPFQHPPPLSTHAKAKATKFQFLIFFPTRSPNATPLVSLTAPSLPPWTSRREGGRPPTATPRGPCRHRGQGLVVSAEEEVSFRLETR